MQTVDECCEKTLKMMDKPIVAPEEKKGNASQQHEPDDENSSYSDHKEDEFNKVQKIDEILRKGDGQKAAGADEIKLDFSEISEIKEQSRVGEAPLGNDKACL